ncbi:MAG TPA: CopG family transcriptional regulator [Thermoanaerobaculia bacterium]|nr:CopG family transcriptional regulator [Thermoanaerobaculia bacterium]
MPRLTISLTPERHRALKETAARRGKTIRSLVEESLDAYGVKTTSQAAALVARARARSGMTEADAMRLAVSETRAQRRRR